VTGEVRHAEIEELLGVYALDAVEPDERDLVDQHLPTCAKCRAEVAEHREVAALLAHSGAPAPAGLWDRIADSLEGGEAPELQFRPAIPFPSASSTPAPPTPASRHASWRNRAAGALLAAAAAVIAVMGVQMVDQDRRLDQMSALLELDALDRAYQAAAAMPGSERVEVTSFDGSLGTEAVVTEDGSAYLQASTLPPLPEGRTYQLWGDLGDRAVSLGVLGAEPKVIHFEVSEQFRGLAITEEEAPGVAVTDQPILAYGQLHND
jgi:hypothetical protein